jgi:hypothetical protein
VCLFLALFSAQDTGTYAQHFKRLGVSCCTADVAGIVLCAIDGSSMLKDRTWREAQQCGFVRKIQAQRKHAKTQLSLASFRSG